MRKPENYNYGMLTDRSYWIDLSDRVKRKRKFETIDIVKRLTVLTAENVELENFPVTTPKTMFNPTLIVEDETLRIFARITLGYYTYTSAVAEFTLKLDELEYPFKRKIQAKLVIMPDNRFDFWGVEDPRVYKIDGILYMTYSGRTVNYFRTDIRTERTLPVTAVFKKNNWRKIAVFRMKEEMRSFIVSDKNAFLMKSKELLLFHRPHLLNERFYLSVCSVPQAVLELEEFREIEIEHTMTVFEPADFEVKLGWATPPLKINNEYLVLIHGMDKELYAYRVFAVLMDGEGKITALTPFYIMEPKEIYEVYGDRPYVVFPCGLGRLGNKLVVSYGTADLGVGIGEIELEELMDILEKNRLY